MTKKDMGLSVYELARASINSKGPIEDEQLRLDIANIGAWFSANMYERYYMLLCKELSDYTIFNFMSMNYAKGIEELQEVLTSRGDILQIDYNHDYRYFEIWVRNLADDEAHMYILFPCPSFVIEV